MLKNESAQNATKPVPLRPSRLPDSGGIFTLSNGLRMEKISRSVQKSNRQKKIDADCTVRTVRRGRAVRPYDDVSGGDMVDVDWQVWSNDCLTRVHWWLMVCCHVAQSWAPRGT
jgi:hypothetical protein